MHVRSAAAVLRAVAALAALAPPLAAQPADIVLVGGRVFTADPARPWAEAVAVRGDRIVHVGTSAEVERLAGPSTRRVALDGRVVVPGFNDAHAHLGASEYGVAFRTTDAPEADPPLAQVLDSLRALAARTPPGTWLRTEIGMRVVDDTTAMRRTLDAVAPDHPVLLGANWGHATIVNSAALRAYGIAADARDFGSGWYGRDASGALDGRLYEYVAWAPLRALHSRASDSAVVGALRGAAGMYAALGVTSVQNMAGHLDPARTAAAFRAADLPLRVRVVRWPTPDATGRGAAEWQDVPARLAPLTVVSGTKYVLDGTPMERLALMRRAYADRPGWHGRANFPADTIRAMLAEALRAGDQPMLHVAGDSLLHVVFDAMQALAPDSAWRRLRPRIEHGDWLGGDLIPIARRLGVVVVQNPVHFALSPHLLAARFGGAPGPVPGFQVVRELAEAGVPLAIGSDGPPSPFLNLMFATTHPVSPAQALTREQAVVAYTRGAAYAEHAEHEKGTLAPGMLADLAVLSQDVFTVPPQALPATTSLLTLVGGRVVHDALGGAAGTGSSAGRP